jgi:MFS family permease
MLRFLASVAFLVACSGSHRSRMSYAAPAMEMALPELTTAQKAFTMLGALLGMLLAALDQTIVATAGPDIQKSLAIPAGLYVWITTSYLVASTVLVPIYGKLSDLYGRKRILLAAIGIFLTGSLACGLSRTAEQLIAARVVQGLGSAGLFTSAFAVVADLFPPAERGKWQGLFGAVWGVSSVVGPLAGGFITDTFGWNWTFFVNLPIGGVAIFLIVARMPALRRTLAARPKLDIAGALALAVAAVPLLLALSLGHAEAARSWARSYSCRCSW